MRAIENERSKQVDKTLEGEESPEGMQSLKAQNNVTEGRDRLGWAKGTAKPSCN